MSPALFSHPHIKVHRSNEVRHGDWRANISTNALVLEAWSEGFMVGSLMIMACITVANSRRGVLLHKLILLELLLAIPHGTFCFMTFPGNGWYLSATASLLYLSCFIHNILAWIKVKPFVFDEKLLFAPKTARVVSRLYLWTLALAVFPNLLQIVCSFLFFNGVYGLYEKVRPTESLFRDPWWLFSCFALIHVVRKCYSSSVFGLISRSPRLGILLAAIFLSMVFTLMDILAVATPWLSGGVDGFANLNSGFGWTCADENDRINPYWKFTLVFKCLSDNIMLDDFKTELLKLSNNSQLLRLDHDQSAAQNTKWTRSDRDVAKPSTLHVHAEAPYAMNNRITDLGRHTA